MTTLINPALGRSSGAFTIAGCTVGATGIVTVGTIRTITGQITEWEMTETNEVENISPSTSRNANEVITETMNSLSFGGFLFAGDSVATPTNWPWAIGQSFDYIQCVGSWAGRTFTFIGVMKSYNESIGSKGKIPFKMEVGFPDIGAANPAFS